jgi:hypothetical protein
VPGVKLTLTVQFPRVSFFAERPVVLQLLKLPARLTFFAFGAEILNSTSLELFLKLLLEQHVLAILLPPFLLNYLRI